jgi:hypothetical protein
MEDAEVGIAVENSTDVAKASWSIVLTEPGTKVIIDAIRISRQIYQRMLTWVINKVTKVIQFVGLLVLGYFWLHGVVLSVLGMVLLVFANDFAAVSLATCDYATHASIEDRALQEEPDGTGIMLNECAIAYCRALVRSAYRDCAGLARQHVYVDQDQDARNRKKSWKEVLLEVRISLASDWVM